MVGAIIVVYELRQRSFSPLTNIVIITALLLFVSIIGGYRYNWRWIGVGQYSIPPKGKREWHHRKTLWDWMQMLIVPVVLAIGGFWFSNQQRAAEQQQAEQRIQTDREIAADNQREAALQAYIDSMSEHLLRDGLRTSLGSPA
jgi:hypothetical protein